MLIPVSLLSAYRFCPRKVFLERVLGLREPPRPEMFIGSLRHSILERYAAHERADIVRIARNTSRDDIEAMILETYTRIVREEFSKRRDGFYEFALDEGEVYEATAPTLLADAQLRSDLIGSFLETHDVEHESLYEQLTPRILPEQRFTDPDIGITGVIDRILVYDHEAIPFEFKTGKAPKSGMWPGHHTQLSAYLVLLSSSYRVTHATIRYLDAGRDARITLNPFVRKEVVSIVEEVREVLEGSSLPRRVEQRVKCARCGLKDACYSEQTMTRLMVDRFGTDAVVR